MSVVKLSILLAAASVHETGPSAAEIPSLEQPPVRERGLASWYGDGRLHGRITANGEDFDPTKHTCAHRTLPLGSSVLLVNVDDPTKRTWCRINDRGPYGAMHEGEWVVKTHPSMPGEYRGVLDVSVAAAQELGTHGQGLSEIEIRYFVRGPRRIELAQYAADTPDGG